MTDSIRFCLPENSLIIPSVLKDNFPEYSILFDRFFFPQQFECVIHCLLALLFLMRVQLLLSLGFPSMWWVAFLLLSSRCSLSFNILTVVCLGVDHFVFILVGVYCRAWMCIWKIFIKFHHYSVIISSSIISASFSFSFLLLMFPLCIHGPLSLGPRFSSFLLSLFWLYNLYWFIFKSLILSSASSNAIYSHCSDHGLVDFLD